MHAAVLAGPGPGVHRPLESSALAQRLPQRPESLQVTRPCPCLLVRLTHPCPRPVSQAPREAGSCLTAWHSSRPPQGILPSPGSPQVSWHQEVPLFTVPQPPFPTPCEPVHHLGGPPPAFCARAAGASSTSRGPRSLACTTVPCPRSCWYHTWRAEPCWPMHQLSCFPGRIPCSGDHSLFVPCCL